MGNILTVKDLTVKYGEHIVVDSVNLNFRKNKITAIIGPSGCGKSSALQGINTLLLENSEATVYGKMKLEDREYDYASMVKKKDELSYIRTHIGMVFQQPMPFPLSIDKNMRFALEFNGIGRSEIEKQVKSALERVNLYDEVKNDMKKKATKLSGGQQQRLCIARTLTTSPKVLFLDEPCSALDIKNTAVIEKLLTELKSDITIVLVTHNIEQAKRISDDVIFMLDGKIIESGSNFDIFNQPKDIRTKHYTNGILEGL